MSPHSQIYVCARLLVVVARRQPGKDAFRVPPRDVGKEHGEAAGKSKSK